MIHPLVVEDASILAAVACCVCSGAESITNPLDGPASARPVIHTDDIESRNVGRESRARREEHFSGSYELVLLASVDGHGGIRERTGGTISNLDKHQAIVVEHYEVDFAVATAVISLHRLQSPVLQVSVCPLLDRAAYSSRASSCHA
jgi:hypothetical protein